jgi:hypothetical protein
MEIALKNNVHICSRAHEIVHMCDRGAGHVVWQFSDIIYILWRQDEHVRIGSSELKDPVFALFITSCVISGVSNVKENTKNRSAHCTISLVQNLFSMSKESKVRDHNRFKLVLDPEDRYLVSKYLGQCYRYEVCAKCYRTEQPCR